MKQALEQTSQKLHALIESEQPKDDSLLGGGLGLSMYYLARYQAFELPEDAEKAADLLETALGQLDENQQSLFGPSFASGGAGLGYMIQEMHRAGLVELDMGTEMAELDQYLFEAAKKCMTGDENHDYLHGAMGIVHYFSFRLNEAPIASYTATLLKQFLGKVCEAPEGPWFRNYVIKTNDPEEINFSLSHGLTSFLLILMNVYEAGLKMPDIPPLVERAVQHILHYRREPSFEEGQYSFFPATVKSYNKTDQLLTPRMAWCYGDLNIVLLLYRAALFSGRPEWTAIANEMGIATLLRKDAASTAVTDSHFCHGAAGLVQFYNTLYRLSGKEAYREGAAYWLSETLRLLGTELENEFYKDKKTQFLEGLPGINMILFSYLSDKPTSWQQAMLL